MFDKIIRTLSDVMHIPGLQINLISLGVLESKGCMCTVPGGVVNVVNGSLIIMNGEIVKKSLWIDRRYIYEEDIK